ncbi:MAG TPA: helix-turn-helix domain-containing protein [Dactylosporangium sp.]|jgi:hypothetical protein|nr:helix-turn-helix domain-containing protein [Dactylosporangium sp.]
MRELVEQVAALDAAASERLKVVGLFDALVEARAGLEGIVRAAAGFARAPAGLLHPDRHLAFRIDGDGVRRAAGEPLSELTARWPHRAISGRYRGIVWLERDGAPAAGDDLVLERLAIAVGSALDRLTGGLPDASAALGVLLDADAPAEARALAARQLRLPANGRAAVVARPPGRRGDPLPARAALVVTAWGPVRACLADGDGDAPGGGPAGVGTSEPIGELHRSLRSAVAALCLTTPEEPVLRAADLGLLSAVELHAAGHLAAAVAAVGRVLAEPWGPATLRALVVTDRVRAAAAACGVHHSTMQARCEQVAERLGYDVRTAPGRFRLGLDLAAHRLTATRFAFEG